MLLAAVVPVPFAFSLWSFLLRKQKSEADTQSVAALLAEKKRQLINKVTYWRVSAVGITVLWSLLSGVCAWFWLGGDEQSMWFVLPVVQLAIVVVTWVRYSMVKRQLPEQLKTIEALYSPSGEGE